MKKEKTDREAQRVHKSVESGKHKKSSMGNSSGISESTGGSREGNSGHQGNPNTGKGHRQV